MERRVVITGIGAITPIGKNVLETWNGIEEKKCGIDNITLFDNTNFKTKLAAEVKEYNSNDYFDVKQAKRLDRTSQFAIIAAREAVKDSNITKENTDFDKTGVFIGSGIGGLRTIQEQCEINVKKGNRRVSPMFIPMSIANMPAGNVSIEFGFKGESTCNVTACASSTQSIGEAFRTIKYGYEDVIIAGGAEASICSVGVAGFENMKALSTEINKNRASIPFDKERNGFVMGEGAGVLVLEELEHAQKRGAKIYAEIIGYGATSDAYHITSPAPGGEGGARAMKLAMQDGNVKPEEMNTVASNIENKISEWQAAVQKLYTLQQEMDAMWDGTANDSFNQNFQGDLQKFNALTNLMQEYVVAIKTAANNYISGEEEVKSIVTRK